MVPDSVSMATGAARRRGALDVTVAGLMRAELVAMQQALVELDSRAAPAALPAVERRFVQLAGIFDLLGWEAICRTMAQQTQRVSRLAAADADERRHLLEDILAGLLDIDARLAGGGADAASTTPPLAEDSLSDRMRDSVVAQTGRELAALEAMLHDPAGGRTAGDRADLAGRVGSIAASLSVLDMPQAAQVVDRCSRVIAAGAAAGDTPAAVSDSLAAVREYLRSHAQDPAAADRRLAAAAHYWRDSASRPPPATDAASARPAGARPPVADGDAAFAQAAAELIASVTPAAGLPRAPLVALLRRLAVAAEHTGRDDIRYLSQDVAMILDAVASGDRELSPNLHETIEYSLAGLARKLAAAPPRH